MYIRIFNQKDIRWWRHQMETFSTVTGHLCGEFAGSFHVFFDLRLNKRLSKQSWGWWFETISCPLWRHCNEHGENVGLLYRSLSYWQPPGRPVTNFFTATILLFQEAICGKTKQNKDIHNKRCICFISMYKINIQNIQHVSLHRSF